MSTEDRVLNYHLLLNSYVETLYIANRYIEVFNVMYRAYHNLEFVWVGNSTTGAWTWQCMTTKTNKLLF